MCAGGRGGFASARGGLHAASLALRASLSLRRVLACANPPDPPSKHCLMHTCSAAPAPAFSAFCKARECFRAAHADRLTVHTSGRQVGRARSAPRVSLRLASAYTQRASRCAQVSRYAECSPARDPRARPPGIVCGGAGILKLRSQVSPGRASAFAPQGPVATVCHGPDGRWHTDATCRPEGVNALARTRARTRKQRH